MIHYYYVLPPIAVRIPLYCFANKCFSTFVTVVGRPGLAVWMSAVGTGIVVPVCVAGENNACTSHISRTNHVSQWQFACRCLEKNTSRVFFHCVESQSDVH